MLRKTKTASDEHVFGLEISSFHIYTMPTTSHFFNLQERNCYSQKYSVNLADYDENSVPLSSPFFSLSGHLYLRVISLKKRQKNKTCGI